MKWCVGFAYLYFGITKKLFDFQFISYADEQNGWDCDVCFLFIRVNFGWDC